MIGTPPVDCQAAIIHLDGWLTWLVPGEPLESLDVSDFEKISIVLPPTNY